MASRNKYRQKWLRWHKSYERRAAKEFRKVFIKWGRQIDLTGVKPHEIESYLNKLLDRQDLYDAYLKVYLAIGKKHKERVVKGMKSERKNFPIHADLTAFEKNVTKYLLKFAGQRIVSVHESYIKSIATIIRKEIAKEWDIYDTAQTILELVTDPKFKFFEPKYYKWQSMRIARTETTAASNWAAVQAADELGFVVEKEWITGRWDKRIREHEKGDEYDHWDMNGVRVPREQNFELVDEDGVIDELEFPGDPRGAAANVINCRCTVALVPKLDEQGNYIPSWT